MDNMTTLRTFRAGTEIISSDPTERTDYDQTTWTFHPATGLELSKTYADGTAVVKTYDAYNRLATETDARGNVKTHFYEHARGLHLGTTYTLPSQSSEGATAGAATNARSFSYNHLGQLTQLTDDSGVRSFSYNTYGERESDSLAVDGDVHLVTELRDAFGRSIGYTYAKNGSVLQTVSTGYGADGRINSAGFMHGGEMKQFGYEYLQGSNLLHKLTKPNGMSLTQSYEAQRDLLTGMAYHRGSTLVAQREYTYDVLGRPTTRNTARKGSVVNDTFVHNTRSELVGATVNSKDYGYTYDNVGNRTAALEESSGEASRTVYSANELNQYTAISENGAAAFVPQFDADGNQTLIKTETGIWTAVYNAENRPVSFTNEASNTVITCAYDSMGRRAFKQVTVNGTVTLHQRYLYRGYLQISCIDLTRSQHPGLWLITWDPTQPIATRPLAIQKDGTWYTYGIDLTKNVCEVFGSTGLIGAAYTYSPYGSVSSSGSFSQPVQWSSEFYDSELGLIYYNFRHYNPETGNWTSMDLIEINNLYQLLSSNPCMFIDVLGGVSLETMEYVAGKSNRSRNDSETATLTEEERWERGNQNFVPIVNFLKKQNQLKNCKCTYLITYNSEDEGIFSLHFHAKHTAQTIENKINEIYPNVNIKYIDHNWQAIKNAMINTKSICGLIYVGHATWSGTRSTLVFNHTNGIATERSEYSIAVTDLPTTNLIPQNVSILLACRSGSMKYNTDSIAAAMSKHFRGIVLGSENKLNFDANGPNTPSEYGGTIWNEFSGVNT